MSDEAYEIDLCEALDQSLIRLPLDAVREVGPASQTLGGILALTARETFCSQREIAERARLPDRTVRKHLVTLEGCGWIINSGRQETRSGATRRTCTIAVTGKTTKAKETWLPCPWWVASHGDLSWSSKVLLGVILRRLAMLRTVARDQGVGDDFDAIEGITGTDGRFCLSLAELSQITGLSRPSIVAAKRVLHKHDIIQWWDGADWVTGDSIDPNRSFRAKVTPLANGRCRVTFKTI